MAQRRTDGAAAARLYVEYRERIYRFCHARLRSREEAEDAVQNVFMRVHMALDRGVVPEFESAWLYKIAHNVCLSRAESTSRRGSMEALRSFDDDDELPIAAPDVSSDELAGLSQALEAMPHNLRTAILLREWQGLSYAEIADAMDLSVSAVETLIFRARRHLANALEHGPDAKRKTVGARLLDLLSLGWLRNLFLAAGPAKLVVAGAALLALGGGGAVALSDAHGRPAPAPAPARAPAAAPAVARPAASAATVRAHHATAPPAKTASGTSGVRHPVRAAVAPAPRVAAVKPSSTSAPTSTPSTPAPAAATPSPQQKTKTTAPAPSAPAAPAVSVPQVQPPSVGSSPTDAVPTVSVPTVSVPTVSVPTVSLPVGGGVLGGK